MSFFDELKRRNVVRVGLAYGIAGWVILQVADLVLENIEAPPWVIQALMLFVLLGFIASLVIAWAYEITPEGIKRNPKLTAHNPLPATPARNWIELSLGSWCWLWPCCWLTARCHHRNGSRIRF